MISKTPRTDAFELEDKAAYEERRECGDPPYPGGDAIDLARQLELEMGNWERWAKEVCQDFKIDSDDRPAAIRAAIVIWMVDNFKESKLNQNIQRAACELPEGWIIQIQVENGAGWVELQNPDGNVTDVDGSEPLYKQVSEAISYALEHS